MSKKDLLFITEGEVDEPNFIKKYLKVCIPNVEYTIYPYSTTIHTLAKSIFDKNGVIDEELDIKKVLKEQERDLIKRKMLEKDYTDIILVFDFEPHCDSPEFEKIGKMLEYFNDSSDMGKLYINYPMMQSYKHMKKLPDEEFRDRKVNTIDVVNYKTIVDRESKFKKLREYNFPIFMQIIGYHVMKANSILNNKYLMMNKSEYLNLGYKKIYDIEMESNKNENCVDVLNTFILFAVEFNPSVMINKINDFI